MEYRSMTYRLGIQLFALVATLFTGCKDDGSADGQYWFSGYVFDGATGALLIDYDLRLRWLNTTVTATVDETGRYVVGPLSQSQDYSVEIEAEGYRYFRSDNPMLIDLPEDFADGKAGFIYQAYLFPEALLAPDVTVSVLPDDTLTLPNTGTVRLRPVTPHSLLADETDEIPASVYQQVWFNDADLLEATVTAPITNGVATFAGDTLVYGVTYEVAVYGVEGYQPDDSAAYVTAGAESFEDAIITSFGEPALDLVYKTNDRRFPQSGPYAITFVFNRPIEFGVPATVKTYAEILDENFSINSPDTEPDGVVNVLASDASDTAQERGTTIVIADNTMTVSWNPSGSLASQDADDPYESLTWSGFGGILIQPVGVPSEEEPLSNFLGGSETLDLSPL